MHGVEGQQVGCDSGLHSSERHLGSAMDMGIMSEETIAADSKAIMLKARDHIAAAFKPERFKKLIAQANKAAADVIEAPAPAVANLAQNIGLTEEKKDQLLAYFLKGNDQSRYGLAQAVSRLSQDIDDGDEAAELEMASGKLIGSPALVEA